MQAIEVALVQGRLPAATHASSMLSEMVEGLTVHHRLHGVYMRLRVETLAGRWDAVRQLTSAAERAVEANSNTPCPGNVTSLLVCALAGAHGGDVSEARRLELEADSIGMEGFSEFDSPKLRLALLRNDLGDLGRLVDALVRSSLRRMGSIARGRCSTHSSPSATPRGWKPRRRRGFCPAPTWSRLRSERSASSARTHSSWHKPRIALLRWICSGTRRRRAS